MTRVSREVAKTEEAVLDIQSPATESLSGRKRRRTGIEIAGGKRGSGKAAAVVGIFALVALACIVGF